MAKKTDFKIIANGHIVEIYSYEKGCYSDFEGQGGRRKNDEEESDRAEENRKTSTRNARNKVRRQVLANFSERSKFITLTFKENKQDVKECNYLFKKFIERLKYHMKVHTKCKYKLKYLAVIEFQERGAVHYHMICNAPYIQWQKLLEMWRGATKDKGGVDVRDISEVDNVGAYMVKYMLKDIEDDRLKGEKAYLSSKGLNDEIVMRGNEGYVRQVLDSLGISEESKKVYTSRYTSEHHGEVVYTEYNLKRIYKDMQDS